MPLHTAVRACHLPSVSPRAVSIATASAQGRGSHSQSVTTSPQQPVRVAKAGPEDGTVALAEELLRDPCLHSNRVRKEREEERANSK